MLHNYLYIYVQVCMYTLQVETLFELLYDVIHAEWRCRHLCYYILSIFAVIAVEWQRLSIKHC